MRSFRFYGRAPGTVSSGPTDLAAPGRGKSSSGAARRRCAGAEAGDRLLDFRCRQYGSSPSWDRDHRGAMPFERDVQRYRLDLDSAVPDPESDSGSPRPSGGTELCDLPRGSVVYMERLFRARNSLTGRPGGREVVVPRSPLSSSSPSSRAHAPCSSCDDRPGAMDRWRVATAPVALPLPSSMASSDWATSDRLQESGGNRVMRSTRRRPTTGTASAPPLSRVRSPSPRSTVSGGAESAGTAPR